MQLPTIAIIDEEECVHSADLRVASQDDGHVVFHGVFMAENHNQPVMEKLFIRMTPDEAMLLADELVACAQQRD
ncbi:MAG: hypothetical protein HQL69_17575 [Magnetococcales bacterium]|nr:hypothetical protein [Magnetococcales bacterium]